ncbi:MAG: N-acetylmannosamine-6-phosphate 2-epimerase [Armatimonadetes bacterium]|nr:N-acetylmannosamine-6-phosphate 2-epimerase [Armatimonadota bacterium]
MPNDVIDAIKGGIIVSCQAVAGEPFFQPESMARFAQSAELGGAVGIRAKEPDIRAIKQLCGLLLIGIDKVYVEGYEVYITPRFEDAERIAKAGADIIALDCTSRPRPDGVKMADLVARIKGELKLPVMADIATVEEAIAAERAGADLVATTLSGYTEYSPPRDTPDFDLLEAVIRAVEAPVVAEGHLLALAEASACFSLGTHAIVVGTAITRPIALTERFVRAISSP